MENLITAGITIMILVGYFAVPALLATLGAVVVACFEEHRENAVETKHSGGDAVPVVDFETPRYAIY